MYMCVYRSITNLSLSLCLSLSLSLSISLYLSLSISPSLHLAVRLRLKLFRPPPQLAKWNEGTYYWMGGSGRVISGKNHPFLSLPLSLVCPQLTGGRVISDKPVSILAGLRAAGVNVVATSTDSDDLPSALKAATTSDADLVITCGATTSSEVLGLKPPLP